MKGREGQGADLLTSAWPKTAAAAAAAVLRSGRIHRVCRNMDSQGRKVVVCDNGTGVSVRADLILLGPV